MNAINTILPFLHARPTKNITNNMAKLELIYDASRMNAYLLKLQNLLTFSTDKS